MDWKNQLTKTPYLVLFIVLISIGVGTASALITITLAGDVIITGDADVHGDLDLSGNSDLDDDTIIFDDGSGTKRLYWDESADAFDVSDDLEINGNLLADGNVWVGAGLGTDDDIIFFDEGIATTLKWDDSASRFQLSHSLALNGPINVGPFFNQIDHNSMGFLSASAADINDLSDLSISDSLEVGDDIYLGKAEGDRDIKFFEDGVSDGERFQWDDSADAFEVSDDFTVFGKLTVTGLVDPPAVTFSAETHDSIKQLAKDVSDHEEVMLFWNKDNNRFEVYVILQDSFFTLDGKEIKYNPTGIPENSAVNRLAEFEEEERIKVANHEVEEQVP